MATKGSGRKRMTQSEVVDHFANTTGMKREDVKQFFDELSRLATREVETNGEFVLPGFGKLVKAERKARQGRNPATGETIQIPAKTALKFRISKTLKEATLPGGSTTGNYSATGEGPAAFPDPPAPAAELAGDSTKGNRP
jgi:DNA-binding protein HU-beta